MVLPVSLQQQIKQCWHLGTCFSTYALSLPIHFAEKKKWPL